MTLRPVRLRRFDPDPEDASREGNISSVEPAKSSTGMLRVITNTLPLTLRPAEVVVPVGEEGARHLLRRTPGSYLLNQVYGLWFYVSLFLLTLLLTHKLSRDAYGIYAVATTAFNTI